MHLKVTSDPFSPGRVFGKPGAGPREGHEPGARGRRLRDLRRIVQPSFDPGREAVADLGQRRQWRPLVPEGGSLVGPCQSGPGGAVIGPPSVLVGRISRGSQQFSDLEIRKHRNR